MSYPRRGEIWLVAIPGDPKIRPGVVVSADQRNLGAANVIVVPITTNPNLRITHVKLLKGEGGLAFDSIAKCENLTAVQKADCRRGPFKGTLSAPTMKLIERAMKIALGISD